MDGAAAREDPETLLTSEVLDWLTPRRRAVVESEDSRARCYEYAELYDDPFPGREEWVRRPWDKKNWRKGSK